MIDGKRLRELRNGKGYSAETLAHMIDVSIAHYWRIEREERSPRAEEIIRLAKVFGVTTDYLLGLSSDPIPNAPHDLTEDEQALLDAYRQGDRLKAAQLAISDHE